MNPTEIESLVQRWAAAVASGSPAALAELIAEDARDISGAIVVTGRDTFLARAAAVQATFSALEVKPEALVVDGDQLAWRWELTGTRDGKRVRVRGVNFQRLAHGRVVEHWTLASPPSEI